MTKTAILAAVLAASAFAPALAQSPPTTQQTAKEAAIEAQQREMNCVYDQIDPDGSAKIFDNYFDPMDAETKQIQVMLDGAKQVCSDQHGWTDTQRYLAGLIAMHGAVIDTGINDLMDAGLKDGASLFDLWDTLPDADLKRFLETGWYDDKAFSARMKTAVLGIGVPDTPLSIDDATAVLEGITIAAGATDQWLRDEGL